MYKKIVRRFKKGFTLIELLIVLAILAVLAGIVLVSVNIARNKSKDNAIKSGLHGIRNEAELLYSNSESYTGICTDPKVQNIVSEAMTQSNDTGTLDQRCFDSDSNWVVWVPLATDQTTRAWCVDNMGASHAINISSAPSSASTCPPDDNNLPPENTIYSYTNSTLDIDLPAKVTFTPSLGGKIATVSVYVKYLGGDANNSLPFYWGVSDVGSFSHFSDQSIFLTGCSFYDDQMSSIPNDGNYHLVTFNLSSGDCNVDTSNTYVFGVINQDHDMALSDGYYLFHGNNSGYPYAVILK